MTLLPQELEDMIFLKLDYSTLNKCRDIQSEFVKSKTKSTKMWSLSDVYYKHGHGRQRSFLTEDKLREYLIEKIDDIIENYNYGKENDHKEIDYTKTNGDIKILIDYLFDIESETEPEWWITSIHMLDFETQTITIYGDSLW